MQLISVILVLISIGTILGPVGAVVIMYSDNLPALVVPPELQSLMGEGGGLFGGGSTTNNQGGEEGLITPEFVGADVDFASGTSTVTVNVKSGFDYDLTINSLSVSAQTSQEHYSLGNITLPRPVTIPSGQTVQVSLSGAWTQSTENFILEHYASQSQIGIDLVNLSIDVNGIMVQMNGVVGTMPVDLN